MKSTHDTRATKRPVNLSINPDLIAQARSLTNNLSAEVEILLADFVQRKEREREAQAERLRRSATTWAAYAGKHGAFADEFSTL
jgi:post-segregation antitoxin (ccd killing protein)